jgi:hypothetical protein
MLKYHRKQWAKHGAVIQPISAGMAKVNYYLCAKHLRENYPNSQMIPLGMPFSETIDATYEEARRTFEAENFMPDCIIIAAGSGTIAAGVLRAANEVGVQAVHAVMCRTGNIAQKRQAILAKAGLKPRGFSGKLRTHLVVHDPGWEYTERSRVRAPFPCHAFYDLKAWEWLTNNRDLMPDKPLFWNIGRVK